MKKLITLIMALSLAVLLVACSSKTEDKKEDDISTISITHEEGTVDVPLNPQNIAVLDLGALDVIDGLGFGDRVTGIPKQSSVSYLTSYINNDNIANLGSLKEINMEELNALQPEVIFIGGRLIAEYENLSKIAPTVVVRVNHENGYMNSFTTNLNNIAKIFGVEDQSTAILEKFNDRIEALKQAAEGKTALITTVSSSAVSTLGNGSRGSLISGEVGFLNLASDINSTHGDNASFELLLEKNPEYLFVLDRDTAINAEGAKTAMEVLDNDIVKKTEAYKNGNIVYLTPDAWYISEGGIQATEIMINDLETAILK